MSIYYMILLCFFCASCDAQGAGLERLFLTPAQRAQLDDARVRRDVRPPVTTASPESVERAAEPQGPASVIYSGNVRRSDGRSTVWINRKPVNERNHLRNETEVSVLGMRRDGALAIAVPQAGRSATLKIGQSLDVTSGRIEESYARHAPAPASAPRSTSAATVFAAPRPAAPPRSMPRPKRPLRESSFLESDASSGAAPAERHAPR
jgi:hypothetical protein